MDNFNSKQHLTHIGYTHFRNDNQPINIKDNDKLQHIYVIGKSGTGKSTLLKHMALSDINKGKGLCIIDPHGDLSNEILKGIPKERVKDLIYLNPSNKDHIIPFNPLKHIHPSYHHLVAGGLVSTLKKIWSDTWGARMEHILRFTLLTLLNYPTATLLDIQPLLTNTDFRSHVLTYKHPKEVQNFWNNEFNNYTPKQRSEYIAPILNKVSILTASTPLHRIFNINTNQKTHIPKPQLKLNKVMDKSKILICNLSKGTLGEDASTILGSILTTSIQLTALYRATQLEHERIPFYLYIDEAHSFITQSITDILAEARKYKLSLFLAHQYLDQLQEPIRKAIFGNVGTIISFRIGATDAEYLAKEFNPTFKETDFIHLPKFHFYIKLMIDGEMSVGFSGKTVKQARVNALKPVG